MRVRLKTTMAGPQGVRHADAEIDVSAEEGKALIAGGYAELVRQETIEQAVDAPTERAVTREPTRSVKRGRPRKAST